MNIEKTLAACRRPARHRGDAVKVICAAATGCEHDQDGECPYGVAQAQTNATCPKTDKPVEWKEL